MGPPPNDAGWMRGDFVPFGWKRSAWLHCQCWPSALQPSVIHGESLHSDLDTVSAAAALAQWWGSVPLLSALPYILPWKLKRRKKEGQNIKLNNTFFQWSFLLSFPAVSLCFSYQKFHHFPTLLSTGEVFHLTPLLMSPTCASYQSVGKVMCEQKWELWSGGSLDFWQQPLLCNLMLLMGKYSWVMRRCTRELICIES